MRRVQLSADGEPPQDGAPEWEVESSRAYGCRLVLKLRGIDDPNAAERWKGSWIVAPEGEVPPLPEGEYWVERLIGLEVVDDRSGRLGTIEDVAETGGTDLLVVRDAEGLEVLVPLAREIVLEIRESEGRVRVALPEGFFEERS